MRPSRHRILGLALLGGWATFAGAPVAQANGHLLPGRVVSTTYLETVPTAYVATSGVVPTAYTLADPFGYMPTSYVLSSPYAYVAPTTLSVPVVVTSTYSRRRYYLPRSYVVTSATVPAYGTIAYPTATMAMMPVVTDPCVTVTANSPPLPKAPSTAASKREDPAVDSAVKKPAASLESTSAEPADVTADAATEKVATPPVPMAPKIAPGQSKATQESRETMPAPSGASGDPPLPIAPAGEPEAADAKTKLFPETPISSAVIPPATKAEEMPPVAPAAADLPVPVLPAETPESEAAPTGGTTEPRKRKAFKPVTPTPFVRSAQAKNLNVLQGRVFSPEYAAPESGVAIAFASRRKTSTDRVATTDQAGKFSVRLPDGEWSVQVTMPSGRVYTVSELIVSKGQVRDDQGRDIPTLTINR